MPCDFPHAVVFATSTSIQSSYDFKVYKRTECNKTIIAFVPFGYDIGYSQLDPTGFVGYLPSHIQRVFME